MKTAIILLALAGLLFAGTATATAIDQTEAPTEADIGCGPLVHPVCYTYYYYCRNYLNFCPVD